MAKICSPGVFAPPPWIGLRLTIPVTPTQAKPTKSATPMTTLAPATTPTKKTPSPPIRTPTPLTTASNLYQYRMGTARSPTLSVSAFYWVLRRDCLLQQWSLETYS